MELTDRIYNHLGKCGVPFAVFLDFHIYINNTFSNQFDMNYADNKTLISTINEFIITALG